MKRTIAASLLGLAAFLAYGELRNNQGRTEMTALYQLEKDKLIQDQFDEISRLQLERYEVERKYVEAKEITDRDFARNGVILDRLLKQSAEAESIYRQWLTSSGGTYEAGSNWVGGFRACVGNIVELGRDFAELADRLHALQDFNEGLKSLDDVPVKVNGQD